LALRVAVMKVDRRRMTKLLEKAFKEASGLPETEQNALAKWVLDELHSQRDWMKAFAE
jgi:hypothetical protein